MVDAMASCVFQTEVSSIRLFHFVQPAEQALERQGTDGVWMRSTYGRENATKETKSHPGCQLRIMVGKTSR